MSGKQPSLRIRAKVWIEDEKGRGIFGLLRKRIVGEIRDRFVRGKADERIDILSFGGIRDLERPALSEAHRAIIAFLEDRRLNPEKWNH